MTQKITVILVGHGSRRATSEKEFLRLFKQIKADMTGSGYHILHGFIELQKPSVDDALNEACHIGNPVHIIPISLFSSTHVKNDLPVMVARAKRKFNTVKITAKMGIGSHPFFVGLCKKRLEPLVNNEKLPETAILMVGRGSSDPEANGEFVKLSRLVSEKTGLYNLITCFTGISQPDIATGLLQAARSRPKNLVILPYLIFTGVLLERLKEEVAKFAKEYPWIKVSMAQHLGADNSMADYVAAAIKEDCPLPCLSCRYRTDAAKAEQNTEGLKALLYSVRHSLTHQDAKPHEHAHPPLTKHVLVCTNADCADRGSLGVMTRLRRLIKRYGRYREIKVTRTLCMGRCGEGPTVAVYPDGIWYRDVTLEDCEPLVLDHLIGGKLYAKRVDQIMQ